jgi:hypothetical protein
VIEPLLGRIPGAFQDWGKLDMFLFSLKIRVLSPEYRHFSLVSAVLRQQN